MNTTNPYYPYGKLHEGYQTLGGVDGLPMKIANYLLDMPNPITGYEPPDNNTFPRCRIWKLLYWDNELPLFSPLPSGEEKRKLLFDGTNPTDPPDKEHGYRLYAQPAYSQSQSPQQTIIRVTTGRKIPTDVFSCEVAIRFSIFTFSDKEYLQHGIVRTEGIEQAIIESLSGVYINEGCGAVYYDRRQHPDCGTVDNLTDSTGANIGRILTMGITWKSGLSNHNE